MRITGQTLTPKGFIPGELTFGERIESFFPGPAEERYILPGFVDLHVHGGAGADCMEGEEATRRMARFHLRHGTTSLLATTVTAPVSDIEKALVGINQVIENPGPDEARVLGVHLEGPFISPKKLGAQPAFAIGPDIGVMKRLMSLAPIKVVTLAPELAGALELIRFLTDQGIRVQAGHTAATYQEAKRGFNLGAKGFTHLFNAMTGVHHREPGVAGLALEQAEWAEMIVDGLHVHPSVARVAIKSIPHLYAVSDAVAAAGMPEGEYPLGTRTVFRKVGGVFLEDGTLAGSVLTMDRALGNLAAWGFSLAEASRMTSELPARYLGLPGLGSLSAGANADMVVLSKDLQLEEVYLAGRRL